MGHVAELALARHWYTLRCVIGELKLDGGDIGFCLEPSMGATPPCIPAGRYRLTPYLSPRFSRTVLMLSDVPGRDSIEMHVGNFPRDTMGCLLPGLSRGDNFVGHSEEALDALLRKLDGVEGMWITITDEQWVGVA